MTIIAITGPKGAGKDTVANIIENMGYAHLKFADGLKDMIRTMYRELGFEPLEIESRIEGWMKEVHDLEFEDRWHSLEGHDDERVFQCMVKTLLEYEELFPAEDASEIAALSEMYVDRLHTWDALYVIGSLCPITPRYLMQYLGTQWGREMIGENFWADITMSKASSYDKVVISDCRFENEAAAIRAAGGVIIRKEPHPDYQDTSVHVSEVQLPERYVDLIIGHRVDIRALEKLVPLSVDSASIIAEGRKLCTR